MKFIEILSTKNRGFLQDARLSWIRTMSPNGNDDCVKSIAVRSEDGRYFVELYIDNSL
jgi:hypothetical protein